MADLIAYTRLTAEKAKIWHRWRVVAHFATLAFGLIALSSESTLLNYVLAVVAAACEVAAYYCKRNGSEYQESSEASNRHAILVDAFGGTRDGFEVTDIIAHFDFEPAEQERAARPDYYESRERHGFDRLCDNLQESAFWSRHLYGEASTRSFRLFLVVFGLVVVVALLSPLLLQWDKPLYVPRALILVLAFLSSADWLGDSLAFSAAQKHACDVDRRILQLAGKVTILDPMSLAQVVTLFSDYVVARATAPLIPESVYNANREKLERLWRERQSSKERD